MNTKIYEIEIEGSESIFVEIEEQLIGLKDVSTDRKIEKIPNGFDKIKATVLSIAKIAVATMRNIEKKVSPDEMSIEFGLKFDAKQTVVLTQTSQEANFKIGLKWKKSEK